MIPDPDKRALPLNHSERTKHILNPKLNVLQEDLDFLKIFTSGKQLKIKESKTQVMKFNFSKNYDFPPELNLDGFEDSLKVINETKLLGVMVTNDLKWNSNTMYICARAYKKMWILRRMKILEIYFGPGSPKTDF